jgi:hypothetical protein
LAWLLGFTAFAMNPALACSSSDTDEFEYGEAEMIAAIEGTWRLTYARPEGTSAVTFTLAPGPSPGGALGSPPGRTPQCGDRTFTRPAAACIRMSQLRLAARVVEADPPLDSEDGTGWYTVSSVKYVGGRVELLFGDSRLHLTAGLEANNAVRESDVTWQGARVTSVLERTGAN